MPLVPRARVDPYRVCESAQRTPCRFHAGALRNPRATRWPPDACEDLYELTRAPADRSQALKRQERKKKKQALAETPRSVKEEDSGSWVPLVAFEARGLDVVRWRLREGDVSVRSAAGYPFEDVDLSDGDWADYDVEADAPVALSDIETKVELVR